MADLANQIAQGGHVVRIKAGGLIIGYGRSSQFTQDYGTQPLYALGDVAPAEHTPMQWAAQITLDQFVIHQAKLGEAVQLMNLAPMGPREALDVGLIDFEVLDDVDNTVMVYQGCTVGQFSYQITANQFSGQNATFHAKNVERGTPAYLGSFGGPVGRTES